MFIYVQYDNATKAVIEYQIVASKQTVQASESFGYKVNVPLDNNVPQAFYEEPDNYKVVISSSDNTIASLVIINSAKSGIKRKLGGSDLPAESPYKNLTEEIAGEVTGNATASSRAEAIVTLPWSLERINTITHFGVL